MSAPTFCASCTRESTELQRVNLDGRDTYWCLDCLELPVTDARYSVETGVAKWQPRTRTTAEGSRRIGNRGGRHHR